MSHQLKKSVLDNLQNAAHASALLHMRLSDNLPRALRTVAMTAKQYEREARGKCFEYGRNGSVRGNFKYNAMADGFYAEAAAAQAAKEEADQKAQEEAARKAEEEAAAAAKLAAMMALIAQLCPDAAEEMQWKIWDAQMQEAIDYFRNGEGNDPAFADLLEKEWEARKKAREEAKKAAAELAAQAEKGFGLDEEGAGWGASSDFDSGFGGSGGGDLDLGGGGGLGGGSGVLDDLGFGGSDWGDSGLDSDWASEDWASDLLDDALDTDELAQAESALDDLTASGLGDALGSSLEAAAAAGEGGTTGFWAEHGAQVADLAQRYGVQAGLMLGGAAALYLTREQTTEAVAHVAEFVSTKCKPAVNDVMDQVRGAAKKTRVSVGNARSGVKSLARGEGDLIG